VFGFVPIPHNGLSSFGTCNKLDPRCSLHYIRCDGNRNQIQLQYSSKSDSERAASKNKRKRRNNSSDSNGSHIRPKLKQQRIENSVRKKGGVQHSEKTVVILYHKPADVITTRASEAPSKDPNGRGQPRKNVYEDIFSMAGYIAQPKHRHRNKIEDMNSNLSFFQATGIEESKLHAIGRLDAATTGALLFTNDGILLHFVTNPNAKFTNKDNMEGNKNNLVHREKIIKTYTALIMGYHEDPIICEKTNTTSILCDVLKGGIKIPGSATPTLPVPFIKVLSHPTPKTTLIQMGLIEGKNRHIRKLFHTLKSGVMRLHRNKVGDIDLEEFGLNKEGTWTILGEDDVLDKLDWKVRILEHNAVKDKNYSSRRKRRNNKGSKR